MICIHEEICNCRFFRHHGCRCQCSGGPFVRFHNPVLRNLNLQRTPEVPRYRYQQRHPLPAIFDDFSNLSRFSFDSTSILCGDTVFNSQPSAVYPSNLFWTDSLAFVNNTYPILPPSYGVATLGRIACQWQTTQRSHREWSGRYTHLQTCFSSGGSLTDSGLSELLLSARRIWRFS